MEEVQAIKSKRLAGIIAQELRDNFDVAQCESIIQYTPTSVLENIKIEDNTVEMIGYLEILEPLKQIGQHKWFLECILNNGDNKRVHFIAFDEDAKRLSCLLREDYVTHIDGALSQLNQLKGKVNIENMLHFELWEQANTIVNTLGKKDVIFPF